MFDTSYRIQITRDFRGARLLQDASIVTPPAGLLSQNVEYSPGSVATRHGFGVAYAGPQAITAIKAWNSQLGNNLVWVRTDGTLRIMPIGGSPLTPVTPSGPTLPGSAAAIFADAGARLYYAPFSASGSAGAAQVITYQSGSFVTDSAFGPPLTYTPSAPTEPGVGVVTIGAHRLGYVIEYRSGFFSRMSPDSGAVGPGVPGFTQNSLGPEPFRPVSVTAAGLKNLSWALTTTWPAGAVNVYPCITTVANPNRYYYVPGQKVAVTGGVSSLVTFTINISDDDLEASATDNTDSLNLWSQSASGIAPFAPSVIFTYNGRMVYITTITDSAGNASGAVVISNRDAFQEVTQDQHMLQVPGQLNLVSGFALGAGLFLLGPHGTYTTLDNNNAPSTWVAPRLIDSRTGTLAPRGVDVSGVGDVAFVADQAGLYVFDGSAYQEKPISYNQSPDWARINWAYAQYVQVKNNASFSRVHVLAPLDGADHPTHILTWDYSRGLDFVNADYSLDSIGITYQPSVIEIVEDSTAAVAANNTKVLELWVGSRTSGAILRQMTDADTSPYRDAAEPIASTYEIGQLGVQDAPEVYMWHGAHFRVTGAGTLPITVYGVDRVISASVNAITMATSPGREIARSWNLMNEYLSIRFATNTTDTWFRVSGIKAYYSPWLMER